MRERGGEGGGEREERDREFLITRRGAQTTSQTHTGPRLERERERERERGRERGGERDRQTDRQTDRQRQTDRDRETHTERIYILYICKKEPKTKKTGTR